MWAVREKKPVSGETFIFLAILLVFFIYIGSVMGVSHMFSTLMNTAYALLLDVVFFIMAVSVLTGALAALLTEFGMLALLNRLISPLMRPLYGLPGAASLGIVTTYISDNPAILSLTRNKGFLRYFKPYQIPALCNLGTAFGMGLILMTYMIGQGGGAALRPVFIGFLGAFSGSIVSVRLMLRCTAKACGVTREERRADLSIKAAAADEPRNIQYKGAERVLNAVLEGGKAGVSLGFDMVPGVLVICTLVMILTYGPGTGPSGTAAYTGAAYEGIALLPRLGKLLSPITSLLFGFRDPEDIAFPITSLGATGAAMALVPGMLKSGTAGMNEIAVFTAMGMCWSGYLSTHVSMMDALGERRFIKSAILSHTIGGLAAGVFAHYLFLLFSAIAA